MTLQVDMKVEIYQDPMNFKKFEGIARLVSEYRPDEGDGLSMWEVEFLDEPGQTYLRTIYEEEYENINDCLAG